MFKNIKLGVLAACGLGALSSAAEDVKYSTASTIPADSPNWKMTLGVSFRQMGEFDFKSFSLNNGEYFDGTFDGTNVTVVDNQDQVNPNGGPAHDNLVSLHKGGSYGGSEDGDDEAGIIIGASKVIGYGKNWTYDLDLSLGIFSTTLDTNQAGDYTTDVFGTGVGSGNTFPVNGSGPIDGAIGGNPADIRNSYDIEMDAYVFSMGLGARMLMGPVELKLSGGPTVSIVDYDFSRVSSVHYSQADTYSESASDSGIDIILGAYVGADVLYPINEQWTIGAGLRYDFTLYDLETKVADVDLSGSSVELKVQYAF